MWGTVFGTLGAILGPSSANCDALRFEVFREPFGDLKSALQR
jgi:hypothetical protein